MSIVKLYSSVPRPNDRILPPSSDNHTESKESMHGHQTMTNNIGYLLAHNLSSHALVLSIDDSLRNQRLAAFPTLPSLSRPVMDCIQECGSLSLALQSTVMTRFIRGFGQSRHLKHHLPSARRRQIKRRSAQLSPPPSQHAQVHRLHHSQSQPKRRRTTALP